jgi:hypothetical protein
MRANGSSLVRSPYLNQLSPAAASVVTLRFCRAGRVDGYSCGRWRGGSIVVGLALGIAHENPIRCAVRSALLTERIVTYGSFKRSLYLSQRTFFAKKGQTFGKIWKGEIDHRRLRWVESVVVRRTRRRVAVGKPAELTAAKETYRLQRRLIWTR